MATVPQQPDSESFEIEFEHEEDGPWLADIPSLPGVMCMAKRRKMLK
jgi:hypothetical protein